MDFLKIETTEDGFDGKVYFGLFGKTIELILDAEDSEFALECATVLNSLEDNVIDSLCHASIRYCNDFLEMIDEPRMDFKHHKDVLKFVYPSALIVPCPNSVREPVVHLELNCEWEIEHGMEWIVRGGLVLYVGAFNGEDPYDDFVPKERWNYA